MGNNKLDENFKEQYYILREEEKREEGRKFTILTLLAFLIFIVISFSTIFLYFRTNHIVENLPEHQTVISYENLIVLYGGGQDFKFDSETETFETGRRTITVINDSNIGINYKIAWVNVFNDLEKPENLVLTIRKGDEILVDKRRLPANAEEILSAVNISNGIEHKYEIIIEYINQEDMGQDSKEGRFEGQLVIQIQR